MNALSFVPFNCPMIIRHITLLTTNICLSIMFHYNENRYCTSWQSLPRYCPLPIRLTSSKPIFSSIFLARIFLSWVSALKFVIPKCVIAYSIIQRLALKPIPFPHNELSPVAKPNSAVSPLTFAKSA